MNLEQIQAELYGVAPEDFVATREALAKQARDEGDREAAARIKKLRKPTTAAWLVNRLARARPPDVAELATLGEQMRAATAAMNGARLKELAGRRKELVDALLEHIQTLAAEAGQQVSEDVRQSVTNTLLAAVADPQAAEDVLAGRVTRGLEHVGFGPLGVAEHADVLPLPDGDAAQPAEQESDQDRAELRRAVEEAEAALDAAEDRVEDLTVELDERRRRVREAESTVERLRAELEDARAELASARAEAQAGEDELDQARAAAEDARRRRRDVRRRARERT